MEMCGMSPLDVLSLGYSRRQRLILEKQTLEARRKNLNARKTRGIR